MEFQSKITFPKAVHFLQELVSQKRRELPIIVRTRDKLESFDQEPTVLEGKILYIDEAVEIEYVKFKVLEFHDENKELSKRGAEFMQLYHEFKGEEFYMPINCPGRFKFVPYPGRRQRYASVTQVIDDNPRFIKSCDDVMTIPPRGYAADCQQMIPAGTIVEPKQVIPTEKSRYLMCFDDCKNCYFIRENSIVNFTGVTDHEEYCLTDINNSDILLPAIIQFIPDTISPNDVVLFNDQMASNYLVITTAPLKIMEIRRRRVMVAKARQSTERCFVTLLMPMPLCEKFHVDVADFDCSTDKSEYIKQKFGGCRGDNKFIHNKMYFMPISDALVCWLQSPRQRARRVKYIDSSDSDDDYEEPKQPDLPSEDAPPIPIRKPRGNVGTGNILNEVVIPPQRVIHDKDVLQKLKERAKLGYDKVHSEIKRAAERFKHRRTKQNKPYEDVYIHTIKSVKLPPIPNRPLPPLPVAVQGVASTTSTDSDDETQESYDYVYVSEKPRVTKKKAIHDESNPTKQTARVNPIMPLHIKTKMQDNVKNKHELPSRLERSSSVVNESTHELTPPPTPQSAPVTITSFTDSLQVGSDPKEEEDSVNEVKDGDFFSFSVAQTVQCLRYCGMDDLANLCSEQKLDGEFFKTTDDTEIREILNLSGIQLFKLKKIYEGWRPKFK